MNQQYNNFLKLKSESGFHSPSVYELINDMGVDIKIDGCFLCNPHAFDLYMDYYNNTDLTNYMKYYPPQNKILAKKLSKALNLNSDYVLIGNGAIQLIELILKEYTNKLKCIITPTFSTYYEIDSENIEYFILDKEDGFRIDVENLINFCKEKSIEVLVLVNPNNPTGTTLTKFEINRIVKALNIKVIVDESFIDFYDKTQTVEEEVYANSNLIVIRSLSKDFGIAGLRLGYAVISPFLKSKIISKYGLCWNINGLAHFFIETINNLDFFKKYKIARDTYLADRDIFLKQLSTLKAFKVYASKANFFILDCFENAEKVFSELLFEHKIYTRILNDKLHLEPSFLRIACGTKENNTNIFNALTKIENKL